MTNTFICEGKDNPDEMIRTMGDGIFAAYMGGGSVNPLTGEFNFAVREGISYATARSSRLCAAQR